MNSTNVTNKPEIVTAIKDYLAAKNISQNVLATQSSLNIATISNMLNGKWDSISDAKWNSIYSHVSKSTAATSFATADFKSALNLCEQAKANHYMSGLIGDYGMGKTTAMQAAARTPNTFYIYYDVNMKPRHFFYELGKQMGYDFDGNVYDQVKKASDTLNGLTNPLIIVDEASKLTDKMLMTLHVLRDKTINNCGIVLAGMPYFKSNLLKLANKQKLGISEFLSRIMIWHELSGLRPDEVLFICDSYGITDPKVLAKLKTFTKFRNLVNEILLHHTLNN